jgi:dCTP deaminase
MLIDSEIIKNLGKGIIIEPFNYKNLGPNSYDLHLSNELLIYEDSILDVKKKSNIKKIEIPQEGYILQPGELYLGSTVEYTETKNFVPRIDGKSSIGRLGICVHITAGLGDVGFCGNWTLEITVIKPTKIYPNIPICQIYYETINSYPNITYNLKKNSKYNKQKGPTPSKMYMNF